VLALRAATRLSTAFGARETVRKPKKPPEILYGVDDAPPLAATMLSACQHVGNLAISVVTPVIIFHQARVPPEVASGSRWPRSFRPCRAARSAAASWRRAASPACSLLPQSPRSARVGCR